MSRIDLAFLLSNLLVLSCAEQAYVIVEVTNPEGAASSAETVALGQNRSELQTSQDSNFTFPFTVTLFSDAPGERRIWIEARDRAGRAVARGTGLAKLERDGSNLQVALRSACDDASHCDDGLFCNGIEQCDLESGSCRAGDPPCPGSAVECVVVECHESERQCSIDPQNSRCESLPGGDPAFCSATLGCTGGQPCSESSQCDDGFVCNGLEQCDGGRCVEGTRPLLDDGNPCTLDGCNESGVFHAFDTQREGLGCEGPTDARICVRDLGCVQSECGDGLVARQLGEQCDDANTNPNDGCSNCSLSSWQKTVIAGQGAVKEPSDGTPALSYSLSAVNGVVDRTLDGSVLIAEPERNRITQIRADDSVRRFAGSGRAPSRPVLNGSPALDADIKPESLFFHEAGAVAQNSGESLGQGVAFVMADTLYLIEFSSGLIYRVETVVPSGGYSHRTLAGDRYVGNYVFSDSGTVMFQEMPPKTQLLSGLSQRGYLGVARETGHSDCDTSVFLGAYAPPGVPSILSIHEQRFSNGCSGGDVDLKDVFGTGDGLRAFLTPLEEIDTHRVGVAWVVGGEVYSSLVPSENQPWLNGEDCTPGEAFLADGACAANALRLFNDAGERAYLLTDTPMRLRTLERVNNEWRIDTLVGQMNAPGDGALNHSQLDGPTDVVFLDPLHLAMAEAGTGRIRVVDLETQQITTEIGYPGGFLELGGNGRLSRLLDTPTGLAWHSDWKENEAQGRLYVAEGTGHKIRAFDRTNEGWRVAAEYGTDAGFIDGDADVAAFYGPRGLALSADGDTLLVADAGNHAVRAIKGLVSGALSVVTVIGQGTPGQSENGTMARSAFLTEPSDVAIDPAGRFYISETGAGRILKLESFDDDSPVKEILRSSDNLSLEQVWGLEVDTFGNLHVATYVNYFVLTPSTTGEITADTIPNRIGSGLPCHGGIAVGDALEDAQSQASRVYAVERCNGRLIGWSRQ